MFKRWAWSMLRPIVDVKVTAWLERYRARYKFTPEATEAFLAELLADLDRAFGRKV